MLTAKENMREVVRGGNPDRVVNQYEAVQLIMHPQLMFSGSLCQKGGPDVVDAWGVTNSFPKAFPASSPFTPPTRSF